MQTMQSPSRTLIVLVCLALNVNCSSGDPVVRSPQPPIVDAETGSPVYLVGKTERSYTEEPRYYIPELVCHGLRKPTQYDGQWVLGHQSKKSNEFWPSLFFDNEMNARSCSVYFPGLEIRRRKSGCCWIKG